MKPWMKLVAFLIGWTVALRWMYPDLTAGHLIAGIVCAVAVGGFLVYRSEHPVGRNR